MTFVKKLFNSLMRRMGYELVSELEERLKELSEHINKEEGLTAEIPKERTALIFSVAIHADTVLPEEVTQTLSSNIRDHLYEAVRKGHGNINDPRLNKPVSACTSWQVAAFSYDAREPLSLDSVVPVKIDPYQDITEMK